MLMAFLALGTVIAYVGLDRWPLRLILIASGIPIAIFINVLRICTLGILGMNGEGFMFGEFHSLVGLAWMIPTFGLFMLLMWFLRPLEEDEDGNRLRRGAGSAETRSTRPARFDPRVRWIGIGLVTTLLVGGTLVNATIESLGIHLVKKQVPPRSPIDELPERIGDWTKYGDDDVFSDTLIEVLGTSRYLQRFYALNGDPAEGLLQLHLAYYTDLAGTAPHVPEVCWENHGLISVRDPFEIPLEPDLPGRTSESRNLATGLPYETVSRMDPVTGEYSDLPLPVGGYTLRTTIFTNPENMSFQNYGGYFFVAHGRTTPSAMAVENVAFDLTSEYAYYCKIQLNATMSTLSSTDDDANLERFKSQVTDFLESLMPEMTEVLPDWRDFEGEAAPEGD
jgi:exosortase/archaeosortase family protein